MSLVNGDCSIQGSENGILTRKNTKKLVNQNQRSRRASKLVISNQFMSKRLDKQKDILENEKLLQKRLEALSVNQQIEKNKNTEMHNQLISPIEIDQ